MKRIRKFLENNSDKFYRIITEDEFYDLEFVDINGKYLESLKKMNIKHRLKLDKDMESDDQQMMIVGDPPPITFKSQTERSEYIKRYPQMGILFDIFEMYDEWFVVWVTNMDSSDGDWGFMDSYFKCDQWGGVIRLLGDIGIIS